MSKRGLQTHGVTLEDHTVHFDNAKDSIRIMLAQISPALAVDLLQGKSLVQVKDPDKQAQKILKIIEHFHETGADLLLFPELVAPFRYLKTFEETLGEIERDFVTNICYEHTLLSDLVPFMSDEEIKRQRISSSEIEGRLVNFCRIGIKAGSRLEFITQIKLTPFSAEFSLSAKDTLFCGTVLHRFLSNWGNFLFLICKDYVGEVQIAQKVPMFDFLKLLTKDGLHFVFVSSLNPEPEAFVQAAKAFYYLQEKSSNTFTILLNTAELNKTTLIFPTSPHPKIRTTSEAQLAPLFDGKPGWGTQLWFPGCEEIIITGTFVRLDQYRSLPTKETFSPIYQTELIPLSSLGIEPDVLPPKKTEPPPSSRLHNLPTQPTPFIGREEELNEIRKLLDDPSCRLLTLVGPGGIGKTRLALRAAGDQIERYQHGVFFSSLAHLNSAELLVPSIADSLRFSFYNQEDPKDQLLNYLREKELLLVMDSFEHLLDASKYLAEIIECAPGIKLLVTSRERLKIKGEWILEIGGMRCPENEKISGFDDYDSVKLFLQGARRVRSDFSLAESDRPSVLRICQLVDSMPLGIELASSWVKMLPCNEIAKEIEESCDFLETSLRDVPVRHRSLRAVFEYSWDLLPEDEKEVFMKLCIFPRGFRRDAAKKVTGASLPLLALLVDKSLLRHIQTGRYEMHRIIRQYTEEKLKEKFQEQEMLHDLHCGYYANFIEQKEEGLKGEGQQKTLKEINEEIENVRQAWSWAVDKGKVDYMIKFIEGLYQFYEIRSWFREGEEAFRRAVGGLRSIGEGSEDERKRAIVLGMALARQGAFSWHLSDYDKAKMLLEESIDLFRDVGARSEMAFSLSCLGLVDRRSGDYEEAKRHHQESLEIYRETGSRFGVASACSNLGGVLLALGKYEEAKGLYEESLAIRREIRNIRGVAVSLNNLGVVARILGEYTKAKELYEESLVICRDLDDRTGIAILLNSLGNIALDQGEYIDAQQLYKESLEIRKEIGKRLGIAHSLNNLGMVAEKLKEYVKAKKLFQEGLSISEEIDDQGMKALSLINLGNLACEEEQFQESKRFFSEALETTHQFHAVSQMLDVLSGMATLFAKEGKTTMALELLVHILNNRASSKKIQEQAEILLSQLENQLPLQETESARERGRTRDLEEIVKEVLEIE